MTNCIERLTKIYSYNDDIWISDKERGDIVEDRYDGRCGWAGWPKGILILEWERGRWFEKSWVEEAADYSFLNKPD